MYNYLLLSFASSVVPPLTLAFVGFLVLFKIYFKVRAKFNATVNCWFCNQNTKVPYLESNSWICPKCEQYNGFAEDGGYNREIFQQHDCSNSSKSSFERAFDNDTPENGFCNVCNEAQRLKVEKLSQFEPKREFRYEEELKVYRSQLEKEFRLCATCDRHLNKVLREKKKMVLGAKFFEFICKGTVKLNQPHFTQIHHVQQQQWKRRLTLLIGIFAAINILCLFAKLPLVPRDALNSIFGTSFGDLLFKCQSHVWTLARVIAEYFKTLSEHETFIKITLFSHMFFMMMIYSLGLKLPQLTRLNFNSLFTIVSPFAILGLALARNLADGFRLSKFTALLVVWSILAGGLLQEQLLEAQNVLTLLASLATFFVAITSKPESSLKQHKSPDNSLHKICSEDYFSDDDSISCLSQQLNGSQASSMHSKNTSRSMYGSSSKLTQHHLHNSARLFSQTPRTSSMLSLNNHLTPHTRKQLSPNSSFKTFCSLDDVGSKNMTQVRSHYADGLYNFDAAANTPSSVQSHYTNSFDLNYRERPLPSVLRRNTKPAYSASDLSFGRAQNASFCMQQPALHTDSHYQAMQPTYATTPLLSPYSVSSNAIYQQHRPASLLSPSRFSLNCIENNSSAHQWLKGDYYNQQHQQQQQTPTVQNQNSIFDDHISQSSSQSSGFESQRGQKGSNENSFSTEGYDLLAENPSFQYNKPGLEPESLYAAPMSTNLLSTLNLTTPLNVICASGLRTPLTPRTNIDGQDMFNLRKINEELPKYKRGTLLKKLQRSRAVS